MRKNLKGIAIFLSLFLAVTSLAGLYRWQKKRFVMPAGYAGAPGYWQERGFQPGEAADGSRLNPYDLVVWGSDPEGITAAVAAARNGLKVLLADYRSRVGGLFTLGQLNKIDMNYDKGNYATRRMVTAGIFEEFLKKVGSSAFDIDRAQRVFNEMLAAEKNIELLLEHELAGVECEGEQVAAIKLEKNGERKAVYGRVFIDASQDGDLAYMAGVPFTDGFEQVGLPGKFQACTLVFSLKGVNWPRVMWENTVVDRRPSSAATFRAAWGYDQYAANYQPKNENISFRGLNMVRSSDGTVYVNGLLIYGVNTYDRAEREKAMEAAKEEAKHFVEFIRGTYPGFKNAEIAGFAEELYIRESRHMQALYQLTIHDVLENRDHWDRIGYGSYPVDIQAIDQNLPGIVLGVPSKYAIPFRSLVPPNFDNLLVVGRSSGYDPLAHGSARVVPVGMTGAQAAAIASAYKLATGLGFREIAASPAALEEIRSVLASQGAFVEESREKPPEVVNHPSYPAVRKLVSLALVLGGYNNDFKLNAPLPAQNFLNLLFHGSYRSLNLAGRGDLAEKMYYVMAESNDEVGKQNIDGLVELFYKFNPHMEEVVPLGTAHKIFGDIPALSCWTVFPRYELYEAVVEYLDLIYRQNI